MSSSQNHFNQMALIIVTDLFPAPNQVGKSLADE